MRTTSKTNSLVISQDEFDTLPFTLQRKYFSSLERLRIVEQSAFNQPHRTRSLRQPQPHPPVLQTSALSNVPQRSSTQARRRLRKRQSVREEYSISQAEARWFLSLPDKIRRRQFSREEQVLLTGRCETYILDPADEHLFHCEDSEHLTDGSDWRISQEEILGLDRDCSTRGRTRRRSYSLNEFRFFDDQDQPSQPQEEDTFIQTDDMSPPPPPPSPTPAPVVSSSQRSQHSRHSSFRRTLSLTQISFARHSTSSAPPLSGQPFFPIGQQPWRPRAQSSSGSRHHSSPSVPAFDPEATHYQDPEARKKLRLYLASPQKFDEAIEFGFPSANPQPRLELPKITADASKFSHDLQTFLKDDNLSFLQDHEDDEELPPETDDESIAELDSPITPSDVGAPFRQYTTRMPSSNFSSIDSAGLPASHFTYYRSKSQDLYSQVPIGNREMTLRMTLTRPDLRADDDALYGWQGPRGGKDDPLALEALELSDDMTGAKGAFAVKPNKGIVSRFLRRMKK